MTTVTAADQMGASVTASRRTEETEMPRLPRLIDWLYKAARARKESKLEMARQIGVSYGYLAQLASGSRSMEGVTAEFCRASARYLGIPPVTAMLAAGRINSFDFLMPEIGESPSGQLNEGLDRIASDPLVGWLMPAEVWDAPDSVKSLLVALHEEVTQRELFPPRRMLSLFQGLQDAAMVLEEQDAANDAVATADFIARNEGGNA
jgi:transcriptional regulator with XRE-family HTH domain